MRPIEQGTLQPVHTLALKHVARYCVTIKTREELLEALAFAEKHQLPWLVVGEGSNLVFSGDFEGLVIVNRLKGWRHISQSDDRVILEVAAGENWHQWVGYCVAQGWYGIENLALIYGTVGAAPVQNVGAYGCELSEVLVSVEAWDTHSGQWVVLDNSQCAFSYRDSVFKRNPGRYVIVAVTLRLSTRPEIRRGYATLDHYIRQQQQAGHLGLTLAPRDIFLAVVAIRQSRLPDPLQLPNAGSFFKNPVVLSAEFQRLQNDYPDIVSYPAKDGMQKLAAGWLIEKAGWKGRREGNVGVHENQALVLINFGDATGRELLDFAGRICADIRDRFGVELEIEPHIV